MTGEKVAGYLLCNHQFREALRNGVFWQYRLDADLLSRLFPWRELNHCLSFNRITNDRFRMSTCSEHQSLNRRAFRPVKDSLGRTTDCLVISELHRLMREGVTAVLEAVNELSTNVCALTERLAGELGARSAANAYISFGSVSGFGMHNDDHDVLIFQLDGRKEWRFLKNTASCKATVADFSDPSDGKQYESIVASAGDVLYVPKGTWHNVVALKERSLHLTVSIVYPTISEFLTWSIDQDKLGAPYVDIKPDSDCVERAIETCRDFLRTVPSRENVESFLREFYARRRCSRTRANFPSLNVADRGDSFRRVPFEVITLRAPQPDRHEIYALGRLHALTASEYAVLQALPRTGAMTGSEIMELAGGWLAAAAALESLMDCDLVTTVVDAS